MSPKDDAPKDENAAERKETPDAPAVKKARRGVRPSVLIALGLAIAAGAWILTGDLEDQRSAGGAPGGPGAAESTPAPSPANVPEDKAVAVRVYDSVAEPRRAFLQLTGRTMADRRALLSAETAGRVVEVTAELGDTVAEGDEIVRIATDDRLAQLREAQALVNQREIEFNAADQLSKKGFQSETNRAQAQAQLEAAQAQLERIRVELSKTTLEAPFDGVVEEQMVEVGDFAAVGTGLVRLVDLDPMLVTVQVSEREIDRLEQGAEAEVTLLSGQRARGLVTRIAPTAEDQTRTFEVEIEIENPDLRLRDGVTAEVRLPTREQLAHFLSPAVLTLDDAGRIGVKAVDADDTVVFQPVDILEDTARGMWVTGLPMTLTIISVGQEYVGQGAKVRPMQGEDFRQTDAPKIDENPEEMAAPPRVSQDGGEPAEAQR